MRSRARIRPAPGGVGGPLTEPGTLDDLPVPKRDPAEIRETAAEVGREVLARSSHIDAPDFTAIHPDDLALLVDATDRRFLNGTVERLLDGKPLAFRLSQRMTRAGGKTTRRRREGRVEYEIAVSATLLFDGFAPDDPGVAVAGIPCANRLEALQRIVEHEIVHLAEFLRTGASNCRAEPFQTFARRVFGHRSHRHELITRRERAARGGILVGSLVRFEYRGAQLAGRVNRITKRATVLVADPRGERYSDGMRYAKYYVPLAALRPAEPDVSGASGAKRR